MPETDVSIVIPSLNRAGPLVRLVRNLLDHAQPAIVTEIVVVLDGSTDESLDGLNALETPDHSRLVVLWQENRGRAAARNAGIKASSGHVLLFLDDDVMPVGPIAQVHHRAQQSADAVIGRIVHGKAKQELRTFRDQSNAFYAERHERLQRPEAEILATDIFAGNLSVKREWLVQLGGFDESFSGYGCEDWDLGQRLLLAGANVRYCPAADVIHESATSTDRWLRDAHDEASSQWLLIQKHPTLARYIDLGSLHEESIAGRLVSHSALRWPGFAPSVARCAMQLSKLTDRLPLPWLTRRLITHGWRLEFWSTVRDKMGSATITQARLRFHGRILCYHRVTDHPNPALATWAVRPSTFRRHMQYLKDQGYVVMTARDLLLAFTEGQTLSKTVAITFDDGCADVVRNAAPILREFGFAATLYAVSDLVGRTAEWDVSFGGEMAQLAGWDDLQQLIADGWEIGHHTRTHCDLTLQSDDQLSDEVVEGRRRLEGSLQSTVTTFAYPYGSHDARVRNVAKDAGFLGALALGSRVASGRSPAFATERVCILRTHSMVDFRLLLWCGLDLRDLMKHALRTPLRMFRPGVQQSPDLPA